MKIKYLLLPLAFLITTAFAESKELKVPFIHQQIAVTAEDQFNFDYDLTGAEKQRVVCLLENFDQVTLENYDQNNKIRGNRFFPGDRNSVQQVYFTSKESAFGSKGMIDQGLDNLKQFQVVRKGSVHVMNTFNDVPAYATCFYVPENTK